MKVRFKKLSPEAILPKRSTEFAAGYDLSIPRDTVIKYGRQVIKLDIAIEMPNDVQGLVDPRSGFSAKGFEGHAMSFDGRVSHTPYRFDCDVIHGKIDPDYRDSIGIIIQSHEKSDFMVKAGTRIAQLTFVKFEVAEWEEVEELSETERNKGGFGHTGTQKL